MNPNVMKGLKIVVSLAGVGVTLASTTLQTKISMTKLRRRSLKLCLRRRSPNWALSFISERNEEITQNRKETNK